MRWQDIGDGVRWYNRAAVQGHTNAPRGLVRMYYSGDGIPKDHPEAVRWLRIIATQGQADTQHDVALMYFNGASIPKDNAEGVRANKSAVFEILAKQAV